MSFLGDLGSDFLSAGANALTLGGFGASQQGNAEQDAAEQALAAQTQQQQEALGDAQPTAGDLQALDAQLSNAEKFSAYQSSNLNNYQATLNAINPAYVSAGANAYALLNGQDAPTLAPLKAQLTQQQNNMNSKLEQAYGPGFGSSSAGIEAQARFNQTSGSDIANAQQSYLSTVGNIAGQGYSQAGSQAMSGSALAGSLYGGYGQSQGAIATRQIGALTGSSLTGYQGANDVSNAVMGSWGNQLGNSLVKAGAAAGTAAAGKNSG